MELKVQIYLTVFLLKCKSLYYKVNVCISGFSKRVDFSLNSW